jgi:hypothetical protein
MVRHVISPLVPYSFVTRKKNALLAIVTPPPFKAFEAGATSVQVTRLGLPRAKTLTWSILDACIFYTIRHDSFTLACSKWLIGAKTLSYRTLFEENTHMSSTVKL